MIADSFQPFPHLLVWLVVAVWSVWLVAVAAAVVATWVHRRRHRASR